MQFTAKVRFLRYSPFKLRQLADVVRGRKVEHAIRWLSVCSLKRALPLRKLLASAAANAVSSGKNVEVGDLVVSEIRVDQGPSQRYYKPGAMGRASLLRRRLSHASVVLTVKKQKEV
jgi:large subunit ribosomal protein L22